MRWAKMNGNGNDFLVFDDRKRRFDAEALSRMARLLCRRREAFGADGILVAGPSDRAAFSMRLFNSDGSEGEMCGNGARCMARFAVETEIIAGTGEMTFETLGGDVRAVVEGRRVRLLLAPVSLEGMVLDEPVVVGDEALRYSFLTVGVPHCVVFLRRPLPERNLLLLGETLRHRQDLFPQGTNVNFVVEDGEGLFVTTYERGVEDLTRSCGTGSTASAIVACLLAKTGREAAVRNPGGVNDVSLCFDGPRTVFPCLTGEAALVGWVETTEEAFL
jgi:diaminopimelate epimerase